MKLHLGHIYAKLTVKPLPDSTKSCTGKALVDTGATDTFLPASVLQKLGIKPAGKRSYELADGSMQDLPIGFGVVEVQGLPAGCTLVFAGEKEEPLLGVTVLESIGLLLDPRRERLIQRNPKRKAQGRKTRKRAFLLPSHKHDALIIAAVHEQEAPERHANVVATARR